MGKPAHTEGPSKIAEQHYQINQIAARSMHDHHVYTLLFFRLGRGGSGGGESWDGRGRRFLLSSFRTNLCVSWVRSLIPSPTQPLSTLPCRTGKAALILRGIKRYKDGRKDKEKTPGKKRACVCEADSAT